LQVRFADLLSLEIPAWLFSLSAIDPGHFPVDLQEELIEATNDDELKLAIANSYSTAWLHHSQHRYPKLFAKAELLLLAFPTSYMVEAGFSHVVSILSKERNRLDIVARGDLRLKLTSILPRIPELAKNVQGQGSH
jgi:hypothetical protein